MSDQRPLPDGWIQQHDHNYDHPFWVDTRATPPRAIWVHPYEDKQFLDEHPESRQEEEPDLDAPPSYDAATGGRTSGSREKSNSSKSADLPDNACGPSSHTEHKRGVFGRLKDKTIGTKEEREEHRRAKAEQAARAEEQARRERKERKRIRAEQAARAEEQARQERKERRRIRAEQEARAEEQARQARMRQLEEREAYMRAHGGYAPYHPSYGGYPGYYNGPRSGSAPGMDNTAALLLGGLAGGLLLGDIFGGGF